MPLDLPQQLKLCPQCGTGYLAESTRCDRCDVPLAADADIDVVSVEIKPPTIFIGDDTPLVPKKLPDRLKVCEGCGASVAAILTVCPECKHRLPLEADIHITDTAGIDHPPQVQHGFSLWMLFALTTTVAVACALGAIHPGLGLVFGVTAGPALIWTLVRVRERTNRGQLVPWNERASIFVTALATIIAVIFVGLIAISLVIGILMMLIGFLFRAW
jgi:hypothetical protein